MHISCKNMRYSQNIQRHHCFRYIFTVFNKNKYRLFITVSLIFLLFILTQYILYKISQEHYFLL